MLKFLRSGLAGLFAGRRRFWARQLNKQTPPTAHATETCADEESTCLKSAAADVESLVGQMLADGRYSLLLRPQISQNLTFDLYQKARGALESEMGLVPLGEVHIDPSVFDADYQLFVVDGGDTAKGLIIQVQPVFLDRYPVTNKQYQRFVAAGGYQEMAIWNREVLPAVLDFTDNTGQPGPRFWKNGKFPAGEANLPVVGISWYEAIAYSRWVGKRLPTDAEWVKAGSWPVTLSGSTHLQRKYPWGDTMDRHKANVWGSGPDRIVPVDEFADGVSVGGLYQLIGNVWEWTATNLDIDPMAEDEGHETAALLKTIRGGAFDTYFESHANCQFASGENPILRKHNIGFRCALGLCDLAGAPLPKVEFHNEQPADFEPPTLEFAQEACI